MDVVWDLERERATLGGLLTLLCEAGVQTLSDDDSCTNLYIRGGGWRDVAIQRLISEVVERIVPIVRVHVDGWEASPYESLAQRTASKPYFSLQTLIANYMETGLKPVLKWNAQTERAVIRVREQLAPCTLAVHMKRVRPYSSEQSNADTSIWAEALGNLLAASDSDVVVVGDDALPDEIARSSRLVCGKDVGLDLGGQLALVSKCTGFVGMASGVSSAAIFSETSYVIFKHPEHDPMEMHEELAGGDRFAFASPNQKVLRMMPDIPTLSNAFNSVLSSS